MTTDVSESLIIIKAFSLVILLWYW